ncbi:hypothetical protein [Halodurantibacterium flavum]|uniref:Uncharacterized protein n=1 Tax=Halodurantibacterium flavum TaxID=1382802 RepID=A0ABW4S9S1_9RHOB
MAIFWNEKVFLCAIEPGYGQAPVLSASDAILATNIRLTPMEGQDVSRDLELPFMGAEGTIPADIHVRMQFNVELVASGAAGQAPAAGKILRACGCAEVIVDNTSVTYTPVSRAHESAAIHLWIGDTRYVLKGSRGTAVLRVNASGVPMAEIDMTGLFVMPSEVQPVVPDLDDQIDADVQVATSANTPVFTIGGAPFVMRSFALNLGNRVETRFLIGSESVLITGRSEMIETTVEAVPLTTFNPFAQAQTRAKLPVALQHGTAAGHRVGITVPRAQMQRLAGLEEQQGIKEWPLRLVPLHDEGNDQFAITFT